VHDCTVTDLIQAGEWDADQSGFVDAEEFDHAVSCLIPNASREACTALFELLDTDKSGTIEYRELDSTMRRYAQIGKVVSAVQLTKSSGPASTGLKSIVNQRASLSADPTISSPKNATPLTSGQAAGKLAAASGQAHAHAGVLSARQHRRAPALTPRSRARTNRPL